MKGLAGVFGDRPNACGVETYKDKRKSKCQRQSKDIKLDPP